MKTTILKNLSCVRDPMTFSVAMKLTRQWNSARTKAVCFDEITEPLVIYVQRAAEMKMFILQFPGENFKI
jgi:hypothetical protein